MDKKELLKRWALAYTEPSLFYVPWKKKEKEGYLRIVCSPLSFDDSNTIIGGIFDLNGKLISKVTFPNNHWFENHLMEGTYVYKEAVSPKSYELSDDIIFTVNSGELTVIRLNHKTRSSYFKRTYEKIDPTLYYPVTPSEPYSIYEFEHYAYFDWVLRQYKFDDGELLRTIYNVNSSNYIYPSDPSNYINIISKHSYFFKAIDEIIYNGQKRNRIEFEYCFEDDIRSHSPIWNDRDFGNSVVKQGWSGKHISCSVESSANNSDKALWINSVTAEEILNIYKFIVDNQVPPSSTSTKGYYWMYNIWVYNGQYYGSGAECEYKGFTILLTIHYRQTDRTQEYPEEMLLSENTDFSEDYIIKNNVDDLSKYFNNAFLYVHSNTKDLCMCPDSVIINQELLDIINNSETGGES